jgi:hypothetical protein
MVGRGGGGVCDDDEDNDAIRVEQVVFVVNPANPQCSVNALRRECQPQYKVIKTRCERMHFINSLLTPIPPFLMYEIDEIRA